MSNDKIRPRRVAVMSDMPLPGCVLNKIRKATDDCFSLRLVNRERSGQEIKSPIVAFLFDYGWQPDHEDKLIRELRIEFGEQPADYLLTINTRDGDGPIMGLYEYRQNRDPTTVLLLGDFCSSSRHSVTQKITAKESDAEKIVRLIDLIDENIVSFLTKAGPHPEEMTLYEL